MVKFKLWNRLVKSSSPNPPRSSSDYSLLKDEISSESVVASTSTSSSNIASENPRPSQLASILIDDFACICCFQILKSPVTLECGHSFCQLCLAKCYLAGSSNTCPTCRYEWKTLPKINRNLESCIEKLVKFEQSRSPTSLDQHYSKAITSNSIEDDRTMSEFRRKCADNRISSLEIATTNTSRLNANQNTRPVHTNAQFMPVYHQANAINNAINNAIGNLIVNFVQFLIRSFVEFLARALMFLVFAFIVGALVGTLIIVIGLLWNSSRKSTVIDLSSNIDQLRVKYQKKVEDWSPAETQEWFFQLGPWATKIATAAHEKKISTNYLNSLA
jgi:hypothetical protein